MDEVVIQSYSWEEYTNPETGYTDLNCWALDKESKPYLVRLPDFPVLCYVELPLMLGGSNVKWEGFRTKIVYDRICSILGDDAPFRSRLEFKEKLYFYKNHKKYPMLLLCFHSKKSMKTCKNKLSFAFKTRGLRNGNTNDSKDEVMVAVRVWETHIPIERKMLTLRNCKYCQWFKIPGLKVHGEDKISTLENEYVANWQQLIPLEESETLSWTTHPGILSFDIETYSDRHNAMPDPLCAKHVVYLISVIYQRFLKPETRKKEIILLGECGETEYAHVIKMKTESELLRVFQQLVVKYDPEVVTGYNFMGYDNPYLENRLTRRMETWQPIGRLIGVPTEMKVLSWSSSAHKNQDFHILQMNGRVSLDLLPIVRRDYKFPVYKLDYVANFFLKEGKHSITAKEMFVIFELQKYLNGEVPSGNYKDIPLSFLLKCRQDILEGKEDGNIEQSEEYIEKVKQKWLDEYKEFSLNEMTKVVNYCVVDADLVVKLFDKLNVWIAVIQTANIAGIVPGDIFTRGTGVRMQSLIYDEATKSNIVLDEVDFPDEPYEGGMVVTPIPGIYTNVLCFDFSSLYPSVQIAHNIDFTSMLSEDKMNSVPDEECHVIEWEDEVEIDEKKDEEEEENEDGKKKRKKKVPKKTITKKYKYKFVKAHVGLIPRILINLISERKRIRKLQGSYPKGSLMWIILEQTQLSCKVQANSMYGAMGSRHSKLKLPGGAKATTAKARESTRKMNDAIVAKGHSIVYGDSVTGDTPILIKKQNKVFWLSIQDLVGNWTYVNGKEYVNNLEGVEVWSDKGFTKIRHVMRHHTNKRIFKVTTDNGYVKVTEDHSLLDNEGKEIKPKDVKIGDILLSNKLPNVVLSRTGSSKEILEAEKYHEESMNCIEKKYGVVKKNEDLGYIDDYVYDLETANHHFSAGVGEIVVHNTDSSMPDLGITDRRLVKAAGEQLAKELTAMFPPPMGVEFEAAFGTMLAIKKKMYLCTMLDLDTGEEILDPDKMKIRGVTLARRDNCQFQRDFYQKVVLKVMRKEPFMETFNFIIDGCILLLSGSVPNADLTMIKGLGSNYKSKSYMMNIFSEEMQKCGNPLVAGDRITYLLVKTTDKVKDDTKVGYKMRVPEVFLERAMSDNPEHVDYIYYLEKTIRNGIELQLFQVGYREELQTLKREFKEKDIAIFFHEFESAFLNVPNFELREIRRNGYEEMLRQLKEKHNGKLSKVARDLAKDKNFTKFAWPLYRYYVKRRQGRVARLNTRVNGNPILMMVNLAKTKALYVEKIREGLVPKLRAVKKPGKKLVLNIIKKL